MLWGLEFRDVFVVVQDAVCVFDSLRDLGSGVLGLQGLWALGVLGLRACGFQALFPAICCMDSVIFCVGSFFKLTSGRKDN